jgi:hypothetical protein
LTSYGKSKDFPMHHKFILFEGGVTFCKIKEHVASEPQKLITVFRQAD